MKEKLEIPSPPTFSQMMEDLEIMSSDEKIFKLLQFEQLAEQSKQDETTNQNTIEQTYQLINEFLARLETLQRLDTSLTTQNDTTNDQLEKKLKDIIEQLQMCLNKLQTNSFSNTKTQTKKHRMRNVAIIGGGVCGLICIKCCLDGDLSPTCYEMTNDIGGLWNYNNNSIDGKASVMKSTVINTSKEFMAFSDYPPPIEYPNYMHNTKLLEYFRMYATNFNLIKYIRFQRQVTRIQPADDYEQTGCWLIYSIDAEEKNNETCEKYDAVMLATGHHAYPRWANFPGLENFKGMYYDD
ncbi:unnamed protein product [Rotaria sordida]|uniref:Flavin-containing monooxygenase n=2 Tax=Rotaria sordida TaxID=392033 RepID=A0A813RUN7_9BILA|nr:unnamed protein product [Rotaria sordida]